MIPTWTVSSFEFLNISYSISSYWLLFLISEIFQMVCSSKNSDSISYFIITSFTQILSWEVNLHLLKKIIFFSIFYILFFHDSTISSYFSSCLKYCCHSIEVKYILAVSILEYLSKSSKLGGSSGGGGGGGGDLSDDERMKYYPKKCILYSSSVKTIYSSRSAASDTINYCLVDGGGWYNTHGKRRRGSSGIRGRKEGCWVCGMSGSRTVILLHEYVCPAVFEDITADTAHVTS